MSSVYMLEPPTSGKVIFHTNHGDLEIELWVNETPIACRNFIQLTLEGYFDNTIFHRLIKGFMIQGGDPTGTGDGGESIYGRPFRDEFHSRLRFSHRGIIAMANNNFANQNQTQFFITFDKCNWLDNKHTIFGKVAGDTLYNLINLENEEIDAYDKPIRPITIMYAEVTLNPIDDIIPRNIPKHNTKMEVKEELEKPQKGIDNKNLLSFNDEENLIDESIQINQFKSSHEILNDPTLSKKVGISTEKAIEKMEAKNIEKEKTANFKSKISKIANKGNTNLQIKKIKNETTNKEEVRREKFQIPKRKVVFSPEENEKEESYEENESPNKVNKKLIQKKHGINTFKSKPILSDSSSDENDEEFIKAIRENKLDNDKYKLIDETRAEYQNLKADLIKFKKNKTGSYIDEGQQLLNQQMMTPLERMRFNYLKKKKNSKGREKDTLGKLEGFKNMIESNDDNKSKWLKSQLKFHIDSEKAFNREKEIEINKSQSFLTQIQEKEKRLMHMQLTKESIQKSLESEFK